MQIQATGLNIGFAHKMLTDAPAAGSAVKIENPHRVQLMNKVKAIMQAKTKLEKEETALKDIFAVGRASLHMFRFLRSVRTR